MMHSRYFDRTQRHLLTLVNTRPGRELLGVSDGFPIVKITPNSFHQLVDLVDDCPVIRATFFTDARLARLLFDVHEIPLRMYRLASATINPGAGEQTGRMNGEATWTAARDASSSETSAAQTEVGSLFSGGTYYNYRAFLPFVTSTLGTGAVVTASEVQIYRDDSLEFGGNGFTNTNTTSVEIVVTTQASTSSYDSGDYDNLTFSSKGSLNFASTSNNAYNTITISDQSIIQVAGDTKLALITGRDLNNSAPTGDNTLAFQKRDASNPSKLVITYTPPETGGFFFLTA